MLKRLIAGLLGVVVCALAACGSPASEVTSSHARGTAEDKAPANESPATVDKRVDLGAMAGLALSGDKAVLADSMVPTRFWTSLTEDGQEFHELSGPDNPIWAKALAASGDAVFVLGARCDEMPYTDPEVVCSPGTAQLWQLDVAASDWRHLADLGDGDIAGARFVSIMPGQVSVSVSTLPNPRTVQLHLYNVARSTGRVTEVELPEGIKAALNNSQAVICGGTDGSRIALAANSEQPDATGGIRARTGIAAWSMDAAEGSWSRVPEPEDVPDGRTATIGCTGSSGFVSFATGGSDWRSLLLDPGGSKWHSAATPPWVVPHIGDGPVLAVGNSGGRSIWTGMTLYTFDASAATWIEAKYDAPQDVGAVALMDSGHIAVASPNASESPVLSILTS